MSMKKANKYDDCKGELRDVKSSFEALQKDVSRKETRIDGMQKELHSLRASNSTLQVLILLPPLV